MERIFYGFGGGYWFILIGIFWFVLRKKRNWSYRKKGLVLGLCYTLINLSALMVIHCTASLDDTLWELIIFGPILLTLKVIQITSSFDFVGLLIFPIVGFLIGDIVTRIKKKKQNQQIPPYLPPSQINNPFQTGINSQNK